MEIYFEQAPTPYKNCTSPITRCQFIKFRVYDLEPNTNYSASATQGSGSFPNINFRTDGNGNYNASADNWYTGFNNDNVTVTISPSGVRDTKDPP